MCGIAGIFNFNGDIVSSSLLKKMADTIDHRGPDGEGYWTEENFGVAHRRLAIIDLSNAGHQPMRSQDGRYIISYNGELYNYKEIRNELKNKGHIFISNSDTEVVLNSFAEWGQQCVNRFNGMFAFAVWDRKEKNLYLVRDRYGIKPLYYAIFKDSFIFASEQKAILEHPSSARVLDNKALLEYFTFQNIFTNRTLIKKIKILEAGTIVKISSSNGKIISNFQKYWDYQFYSDPSENNKKETVYEEELDHLLRQSVTRQLTSDVELGAYLSGGMDSGAITSQASKCMPYIKSFTCGFDLSSASGLEMAFDEREKAEAMSALYKSEHYQIVLKAGDMERCLKKLAWHLEEPRVGQSYPNYYVAQLASKFVKVVLSGTGGDELFAGYPWRYYNSNNTKNYDDYINKYYMFWQRLLTKSEIRKLFSPIWNEVKDINTIEIFNEVFKNNVDRPKSKEDYINHSLYFEAKTFLHGLLTVEDKLSMAHGLETRVPFLDNDLVNFAMSCPVKFKLKNLVTSTGVDPNYIGKLTKKNLLKNNDGKMILRNVMKNYVPNEIATGRKQGFSSPDASWFKGESVEFVKEQLFNDNNYIYNILDKNFAEKLIMEHLSGEKNRRLLIWSLLNINVWMKQIF